MDLKLVSAELAGNHIQLTYTGDGQAATQTGSMLVLRVPMQSSFNASLNRLQMEALEQLHGWAEGEYERVKNEIEGRN
jgi:hypothetical protein